MESKPVRVKMTQKRRAHHPENMPNKVAKTETEIVENSSYSYRSMSDFDHLIKFYISNQTDKIEKQLEKALQMKDYKYADLKHERDTFELQSKSLETIYLSKYVKLETENNNIKLKLKKHEEDSANYTKKVEKLVKAYKINVNNQNDEVKLLQCEIDSLKNKETFLKSSLESMELDAKNTNKQLVEKDDSIKYLEKELQENIQEITKIKEVSLQQMGEVSFYKKVNEELENKVTSLEIESKTMLSKECDLEQLLKEKHESKECIKILQSDLGIKNQEIFNLKSLNTKNEEKICSHVKKQSETEEGLKERKVELDKFKTLEKQMKADLMEKNEKIYNLESLKTANEEELSSLEQNQRETQEELKEIKIELEKYETVQNRIEADLVGKKQEIFSLQYLNNKNEEKISSLEHNRSDTEEDMKEIRIELERCATSQKQMKADLLDKNQEILYLKSLNTTISSLTRSKTKEDINARKIEIERFTTLQRQMEADLGEKRQEIFNLKSLNITNEEKISFMEQKQSETEEELKGRKIELEKCVTSQKQLKAQEIFQRILAEKLENDLKICESFYGANINHAKKDANAKFQIELENKKSEIKKHKSTICELETQFREKVTEYHVLSKTCAELEKQHGADVTLVKVLENLNVKYCKEIKFFKKEVQRLGGNSSILVAKSSGNSEKSSDNPERERKEKVEDTFKHVENDATTEEEEVGDDHKLHTKPPTHDTKESIKKKEKLAEKIEIISSRDLMDTNDEGKFDLRRRLTRHRENKYEPYYFFKRTETHKAGF